MSRRALRRCVAPAAVALAASPAMPAAVPTALAAAPGALAQTARLQGTFTASGTVLSAVNVPGERRGQQVSRIWTFTPQCPTGACAAVKLIRQRGDTNHDTVMLRRQQPGHYKGTGSFTVPVRCGSRVFRNGERARYTITLTITAAVASGSGANATGFTATYRNPRRTGLTRCYSAPSYDSARYVGTAGPPPPGA
ncbi:MAG: hypothetical protein QOF83_1559 [Solirubrobacteraceae bacterium]|nr:hypothetical protein [Solirubrobacteraceae bacterium]